MVFVVRGMNEFPTVYDLVVGVGFLPATVDDNSYDYHFGTLNHCHGWFSLSSFWVEDWEVWRI